MQLMHGQYLLLSTQLRFQSQLRNTCTVNITAGIIFPTKTQNQSIYKIKTHTQQKKKKINNSQILKKKRKKKSDQIRPVRDRDRRGWGFTVGRSVQGGEGRLWSVRLGGSAVIGATRRLGCDLWDGVARAGSAGWARVKRVRKRAEREKESRERAGGGWGRWEREQRVRRELRAESEKREIAWNGSSAHSRVLENALWKFFP